MALARSCNQKPAPENAEYARSAQRGCLTAVQVQQIEQALAEVGEFGEVHLVVHRGHLRFITKMKSEALER